jgi:hypothetical protein
MVVMNAYDNQLLSPAHLVGIAMKHDISKLCADSLRTFTNDKYDIKLKAAHAHELVAAYFGYSSKNALLADRKYPVNNLDQAEIVVMISDDFIDQRRNELQGLPLELPDSYTLGEAVYAPLFSDEWWVSSNPPFRSFEKLAKYLVEDNDAYQEVFKFYRDIPVHHYVGIKLSEDDVLLSVIHSSENSTGEMVGHGETTIKLPRIAGRIGFSKARVSVGQWSGGARRTLKSLGMQS